MSLATTRPILVALGPEAQALRLLHRAFWMARETGRPWIAVHISVPETEDEDDADMARLWLQEAERLGAGTQWRVARTIATGLLEALRSEDAGDLLVGRTEGRWPWVRLGHALAQELGRRATDCQIHAVPIEPDVRHPLRMPPRSEWIGAAAASLLILGASTGLGWILPPEQPLPAVFLLFLLGTAFVAERYGLLFGAGAVALSALSFDLVFDSHPRSLDVGNWPLMGLFLAVLALGQYGVALSERTKDQAQALRRREALMAALLLLGSQLARATDRDEVGSILAQLAPRMLHRAVHLREGSAEGEPPIAVEGPPLDTQGEDLCQAMGAQVALALERIEAQQALQKSRIAQETDQVRASLLEAIGHDLRTPLAAIQGAASSLLLDPTAPHGRDLLAMICSESERLGTLLNNLLDLTRLESLTDVPHRDWIALDEVAASALRRLGLETSRVTLELTEDLPLLQGDGVLLEQLVLNLVINALRHAPASPVRLWLKAAPGWVHLVVEDQGPGIPDALKQRVFDKFYRMPGRSADGGVGLGLAICEAVVRLHGGHIGVEDAPGGGARFCVALPAAPSPDVPPEHLP